MFGLQMVNEMESFQREIDQLFRGCGFVPTAKFDRQAAHLDLRTTDEAFVVEAPLPGIDVEKLDISVLGRRLTLAGELATTDVGDDVTWHRQERDRGTFRQTLLLSTDVDSNKVEAEYENGVVRISLQKAVSAKPQKISVKAV